MTIKQEQEKDSKILRLEKELEKAKVWFSLDGRTRSI